MWTPGARLASPSTDVACVSTTIRRSGTGWIIHVGTTGRPHPLFETPFSTTTPLRSYDVTADGQFIGNPNELPPVQPVSTLHVVDG